MTRLYNAVKLDLYSAKGSLLTFVIELLSVIIISAEVRQPLAIVVFVMMLATALSSTVFQVSEKNNLDKLYGSLPLKKLERVLARYIYALILGVSSAVIVIVSALILARVLHIAMDILPFLAISGFSFFYYCFATAISYPIFTRFSFSKTFILTLAPIFILFALSVFLSRQPGFLAGMGKTTQIFSAHPYLLLLCGVGMGLVFLAGSFPVSYALSRKKELE